MNEVSVIGGPNSLHLSRGIAAAPPDLSGGLAMLAGLMMAAERGHERRHEPPALSPHLRARMLAKRPGGCLLANRGR